jgi:hypothetical protein
MIYRMWDMVCSMKLNESFEEEEEEEAQMRTTTALHLVLAERTQSNASSRSP